MIRLLVACLLCWSGMAAAAGIHYLFESQHSTAQFVVRVFWVHQSIGSISSVTGQLVMDDPQHARVLASIDTEQAHMDNEHYNKMVHSQDFFDTHNHPFITFRSDPFSPDLLSSGGELGGQLTMRGQTRPVHFRLLPGDCRAGELAGCEIQVRGVIHRSRFGMDTHRFSLGDQVELRLSIMLAGDP